MSFRDNDPYEDLDDAVLSNAKRLPRIKGIEGRATHGRSHPRRKQKKAPEPFETQLAEQEEGIENLDFSYQASRHERQWILDSLGDFYDDQWFEDILRLLKGGKEASVYLCTANPSFEASLIAAKVYRPRRFRNLKKDHIYREGRSRLDGDGNVVTDDGMNHAMNKRTEYGLQLLHTSWIEHEVKSLQVLYAAGVDVPKPYASGNNAILMEYIGDEELPAPTLNGIHLSTVEARLLFERVLHDIELMLAHDCIHGDLSAYNLLYWEGELTIIDFPQAIAPEQNPNAYRIFERDVTRVCEYFSLQGVRSKPGKLARQLWKKYNHPLIPEVHPRYLDDQNEEDLEYGRKQIGLR